MMLASRGLLLAALLLLAPAAAGQDPFLGPPPPAELPAPAGAPAQDQEAFPSLSLRIGGGDASPRSIGGAIEILLVMTLLTLAPAIVMTLTSFTRIIIVLSFMRRAMAVQELPPNLVVTGLAFFLTLFIMRPVLLELNTVALTPYKQEEIPFAEAVDRATGTMKEFLLRQTRERDLALIYELSGEERPENPEDVPFLLVVPAFVLSEVKTAFQMGFVLFLPFLIIDLVIASILISMGMFTLPPVMISTPFKLLLFVLVDGWNLVVRSVAQSFA